MQRYFERLGLGSLPPVLDSLRRLHVAHLGAFPFHNLTIQRGGTVDLGVGSILERFLAPGGGGYCFEQNTLFAAAVRELGFEVTTLLARVGPPEARALNHMLLRVDVDGEPWLADVGFGGDGPLEPLLLRDGETVIQRGIGYSLQRDAHHWSLRIHRGAEQEELYEFSGAPHTAADVAMANHWTATHPQSIFRRSLTIQRVTPEERLILRPAVVTRYREGLREDTVIDRSAIRSQARELFGIELGDAPLLFETEPSMLAES